MVEPTPGAADPRDLPAYFDRLWQAHVPYSPWAPRVHTLLQARGETIRNDHVAFRTFADPRVSSDRLAQPFVARGYRPGGEYVFPEKRLHARHYETASEGDPLVFVSELQLASFSPAFRAIVDRLIAQVPGEEVDLPLVGRPWRLTSADYETLAAESEYGAWVAAFGYRANHFTVRVNELSTFEGLVGLNAWLREHGVPLNQAGGEIKGGPEALLEQSATLGGEVDVSFDDGIRRLPGCYCEFARRYAGPDGALFRGFVERSADRLFHSTDRR